MSGPSPDDVLERSHAAIRQGCFTPDLIDVVRIHGPQWRQWAQGARRLQSAVVSAEILDYYGRYREAERVLSDYGYNFPSLLASLKRGAAQPQTKRKLWVGLAYAQTLYRAEHYSDTRSVLADCADVLDAVDPYQTQFFGTRARLATLVGQVLRQVGDYNEALRQFTASIIFANRRFWQKTPFAELTSPDTRIVAKFSDIDAATFETNRRLAHWTIGKNLALGIGWIHYATGRLTDASMCLGTGTALLRPLHDSIHRAYCKLLMSAVTRAQCAHEPEQVKKVLGSIQDAALGLSKHHVYRMRAHYELAVAYLYTGDLQLAARAIDSLKGFLSQASGTAYRSARWTCNALVLESRLERLRSNTDGAERVARQAMRLARQKDQRSCEIAALIACAEALKEGGRPSDLDQAVGCLEEARASAVSNPKTGAVCTLHLCEAHVARGHVDRARSELNRWYTEYRPVVEHGFVRHLAEQVQGRWPTDGNFVLSGTNLRLNQLRLAQTLIQTVETPGRRAAEKARLLGLKNVREFYRQKKRAQSVLPKS